MLEVTKIGKKNHAYFAPLLFEKEELPQDGLVRIGVLMDGYVCGAAAFAVEDTMAELMTVYVLEKYRRAGVATVLFDKFCEIAQEKGILSLTVSLTPDNADLRAFLQNCGFEMFDSSAVYRFSFEDVCEAKPLLADMQRALQQRKENMLQVLSYEELQTYQQKEFATYLKDHDFGDGWLENDTFSPQLSFVVLDIKKKIVAFMICSEHEQCVNMELMYGSVRSYTAVLLLFAALYAALKKRDQTDLGILFLAENPQTEAVGRRLFGDNLKQTGRMTYAVRMLGEI